MKEKDKLALSRLAGVVAEAAQDLSAARTKVFANKSLSASGRSTKLAQARVQFLQTTKKVEQELEHYTSHWEQDESTREGERLKLEQAEFEQTLTQLEKDLTNAGDRALNVALERLSADGAKNQQQTRRAAQVLASEQGLAAVKTALQRGRSDHKLTEQLLEKVQGAAQAKLSQGKPADEDRELRAYYAQSLPQLIEDVHAAVREGRSSVYFPAVPNSGDAPTLLDIGAPPVTNDE